MQCTCGNQMELKETFANGNKWYECMYCGNEDGEYSAKESARQEKFCD